MKKHKLHLIIKESALNRYKKRRIKWSEINEHISDTHFRRTFRMTRPCFKLLYETIIRNVGESKFKSQQYIDVFLDQPENPLAKRSESIYYTHIQTSRDYISGKVKLATILMLLARGDALDLGDLFDFSTMWCKYIFYHVLSQWIINVNLG